LNRARGFHTSHEAYIIHYHYYYCLALRPSTVHLYLKIFSSFSVRRLMEVGKKIYTHKNNTIKPRVYYYYNIHIVVCTQHSYTNLAVKHYPQKRKYYTCINIGGIRCAVHIYLYNAYLYITYNTASTRESFISRLV